MLALCSILPYTYYAQNYAGIIGWFLLIVTPKDGPTSVVIAKIDDELPYLEYPNTIDDNEVFKSIGVLTTSSLIMIMSAYILIVHLLFKELQTLFGKLLIFYNLCMVSTSTNVMALLLMHYWITVNSQTIYHTATVMFTLTYVGTGLLATCIQLIWLTSCIAVIT